LNKSAKSSKALPLLDCLKRIHLFDTSLDAFVLCPSHDAFNGTKKPLEGVLAEACDLDIRRGNDASRARSIIQKRKLAEEVSLAVVLYGFFAVTFVCIGFTALQEEE